MDGVKLVNKSPVDELSSRTLSLNFIIDKEDNVITESYFLSRTFFTRIFGIVHFFYFLSIFNNIIPLIGSNGLYPISDYIAVLNYELHTDHRFIHYLKRMPLLFVILPPNDFFLTLIPLIGVFISFVPILTGLSNRILTIIIFLLLHTCVFAMNTFNFNISHMMILEVTFLAIFLFKSDGFKKHSTNHIPWSVRWGFRLFVYKILLGSGIGQLKASNAWKGFHALHNLLNMITAPTSFSWFVHNITSNPINDKALTMFILSTECIFSIFVITPIRSCRIVGFTFTTIYSLFFYTLGGLPLFYLVLFASSLFLLDDKAMNSIFGIKLANKNYESKPNEQIQIEFSLDNISQHFWNLFYTTTKADESTLTIPVVGSKLPYNATIHKITKRFCKKILFFNQFVFTLGMLLILAFVDLKWAVFCVIPIAVLIHFVTDLANFTLAYLTTFSVFIITSLWLFKHLMIESATFAGILLFVAFVLLITSLSKSCNWHSIIKRFYFEAAFTIFLVIGFSMFINNITGVVKNYNHAIFSYGIYNNVAAYPEVNKYRYEVVIIGTNDTEITDKTVWKEYQWKSKPGFLNTSPSHIIPYERPLDNWIKVNHNNFKRLLFIYNKNKKNERLYKKMDPHIGFDNTVQLLVSPLLYKLSIGDHYIGSLFEKNPFPEGANHFKALVFSYHMSHESHNYPKTHNKFTQQQLQEMMDYAKQNNYNPELGEYANYGKWWNRQPLLILTEFDLKVNIPNENQFHINKKLKSGIRRAFANS